MAADSYIPQAFTVQYESTFDLALQQQSSLIRPRVTIMNKGGERVRLNNLGEATPTIITTRAGATVADDIPEDFVSIFPVAAQHTHLKSEFDDAYLGEVSLPGSDVSMTQAYAINRFIDDQIVAAMTGSRWTGKHGTTEDTSFSSTQQVAVDFEDGSTNTGLTFEKIAEAAYRLDTDEVPSENRFLGIRAKQMQDLVDDILANHSTDMGSIVMLEGSKVIKQILGFTVVQAQRFAVDGNDIASVIAWQKSQVVLNLWQDRKSYADIRADLSHAFQLRTTISVGATRRRNEGVVEILCDESP